MHYNTVKALLKMAKITTVQEVATARARCKALLIDARRAGDMEVAALLSQARQFLKRRGRQIGHCVDCRQTIQGKSDRCFRCSVKARKPRRLPGPDLLLAAALLPIMPPGTGVVKSPKDAAAGMTAAMIAAPPTPLVTTNQAPVAVIQWHYAPGEYDADPALSNGVQCAIFDEGDAARLEFFAQSNRVYEVQVKAQLWEAVWRVVLRFETNSYRSDGVMKVRYAYGQMPVDVPSRFFRVLSN